MQPTMSSPALHPDTPKVHPQLAKIMEIVMDVCLHAAVFLVPLFFTSASIDAIELPKQTLLFFLAGIGLVAWIGRAVALKSFSLQRGWFHIVTTVVVLGYGVLSLFSVDRYLSLVGVLGQMPWAFSTLLALYALYVIAVNRVRTIGQVYDLLLSFLASSFLIGLYGLFQLMGWHILPASITKTRTFSTIGSIFSLSVYMVAPLVVAAGLAFHGCRHNACVLGSAKPLGIAARILVWATGIVALLVLLLTDYWVAWAALIFGTSLTVLIGLKRGLKVGHPAKYGIPAILVLVSVLLLIYPTPLKVELPAEVAPSAVASWVIAKQALRDMPLLGSGPGTWIYDYAKYRDPLVNASPFWNVRFDRGFSQFLTLLATTGILGIALWLVWLVSVLVKSASHLLREKNDDAWYAYVAIFVAWATFTFTTFFYNFNVSHLTAWFLLLGLMGAMTSGPAWVMDEKRSKYTFEVLVTLLVVVSIAGISGFWLAGQRLTSDVIFSQGVNAFRQGRPVDEVIASLQRARRLNPYIDMYARNLSQAHLIKAAQLIQKQPTQEEAATIQNEIKNAVDVALVASSTNPGNADNFSNLAVIYQSIASFTRGADEFAIANYSEALKREPNNPVFLGEIGKLYLLRSDAFRTQLNNEDKAVRDAAKADMESNLAMAEEVLKRTRDAKADYLPARYYLGIVYERQNKLKDAIVELANVYRLNQQDIGVAFELSILLYRDNQKDLSLNVMEEVVRRDAGNVNAKWYLAAMYEERNRLDEALALLNDLASRFPDNQAVQQRLQIVQAAKAEGEKPAGGLPEPVAEPIRTPTDTNPVSR
ncbi:tetratricopeptide repeat protein [Patescibacteria group bacterium]|jgi:cytochrome c-type biogenesis protein CcmH/NrfG|nr:tetratricopeptide repeat protein [Patescibacteria group bacterium]